MSVQDTARSCKALEEHYVQMRQTAGLETLRSMHQSLAREALQRHLQSLKKDCEGIGGQFAHEVANNITKLLNHLS